jgi:hypothetical protein
MRQSCIGSSCFLWWPLSTYLYPSHDGSYHTRTQVSQSVKSSSIQTTIQTCLTNYSNLLTNFILSYFISDGSIMKPLLLGPTAAPSWRCLAHRCPQGSLIVFSSPAHFISKPLQIGPIKIRDQQNPNCTSMHSLVRPIATERPLGSGPTISRCGNQVLQLF